jgi:two-component system, chemotaxis family, CheB/CheR fusion protein
MANRTNSRPRRNKPKEPPRNPGLEEVLRKIVQARSFDFRSYKRGTLLRRIERRMQDRGSRTIRDYAALLDRDPSEYDALISSMLIKVTSFFRDPEVWDALSAKVLPRMLSEKRSGEEIRAWCAGCATGEEAFSLAITLAEVLGPSFHTQDVKVFGTDVDEKAIAYARKAHYTKEQVKSIPQRLRNEYFLEEDEGYTVRKEIRRNVVFGVNNLVNDAPISRLDVLLCRNVFIYLDSALQKRALARFHYALRRGGILILAKSELIPFAARIYEPVDLTRRIYRKDGGRDAAASQERLVGLIEQDTLARAEPEKAEQGTLERFNAEVLQSLSVPVVATTLDGTVMLWNRAAESVWSRAESDVTGKKLAGLNVPGLSGDLLIEKTRAVREGASERETGSGVVGRGGSAKPLHLDVEVMPLRDTSGQKIGLLYVARDRTAAREMEAELVKANEEREAAVEELHTIGEEMQSSNEELETTNEELQSANEELQTTNEELQSTNEELETTNEELQSTNAELDATNRELAHRTDEMNRLAYFQRTIIRTLSAAVVVVESEGRITMWNLAAERLLGLTESEAIGQTIWTLHVPALPKAVVQRIRKALSQNLAARNEEVSYELPTGGAGSATIAAVPILDGGAARGAVIIFEDVTRQAMLAAENAKLKAAQTGPVNGT